MDRAANDAKPRPKWCIIAADKLGLDVTIEKVTDPKDIAIAGVLSTPGIAIDGKLVHSGGLPDASKLQAWLKSLNAAPARGIGKAPGRQALGRAVSRSDPAGVTAGSMPVSSCPSRFSAGAGVMLQGGHDAGAILPVP